MSEVEAAERWRQKTEFPIGVDLTGPIPVARFQLIGGTVYVRRTARDGTVTRGTITPEDLQRRLEPGQELKEGWYDALGTYLGETIDDETQET